MTNKSVIVEVANTNHPGGWLGRYVVRRNACVEGDGGCANAIAKVCNVHAAGGNRFEFELSFKEEVLTAAERAHLNRNEFALMPFAFGNVVPSHIEVEFGGNPATNNSNFMKEIVTMSDKIFVTQKSSPEPLTVPDLAEAFKANLEKEKGNQPKANSEEPKPASNASEPEPLRHPSLDDWKKG
jgi:hypothetical protein